MLCILEIIISIHFLTRHRFAWWYSKLPYFLNTLFFFFIIIFYKLFFKKLLFSYNFRKFFFLIYCHLMYHGKMFILWDIVNEYIKFFHVSWWLLNIHFYTFICCVCLTLLLHFKLFIYIIFYYVYFIVTNMGLLKFIKVI